MKKTILGFLLLFGSAQCFAADSVAGTTITYTYTVLGSTFTSAARTTNLVLQNSLGDAIAVISDVISDKRLIKINNIENSSLTIASANISGYAYLPNYDVIQWGTLSSCTNQTKTVPFTKSMTGTTVVLYGEHRDDKRSNFVVIAQDAQTFTVTCTNPEFQPWYWLAIGR